MKIDEILQQCKDDAKYNGLKADGSTYSVLVVDDAVFIRNTVKKILSGVGYNVLGEADNGQSAVDMYNEFKPDLVTMDITMPVMEGTEAVKEILKDHPNACVVMLSAMGYRNLVKDCIMAGAKNFIVKPIKADNVKRVLEVLKSSLTT